MLMLDDIRNLSMLRKNASEYSEEAVRIFNEYIKGSYPNLLEEYNSWIGNRRTIDPAVFINETLCDLEGRVFDGNRKIVSFFAGAAGGISDGLVDSGSVEPSEIFLLNTDGYRNKTERDQHLKLFYAFNDGLANLLPVTFCRDFINVLKEYNQAQADSIRLFDKETSCEEIIDIKNRAGGYSVILLYGFLFPEAGDLSMNLTECYDPNGDLAKTKCEALYNFGAWLSRVDDLWDESHDKKKGMKQLATERCVTWGSLKQETDYTFNGLSRYYPSKRVARIFIEKFNPLTNKELGKLVK